MLPSIYKLLFPMGENLFCLHHGLCSELLPCMPTKLSKSQEVFWDRTNKGSLWLERLNKAWDLCLYEVKEFTPFTSLMVMAVMAYSDIQVNVTKINKYCKHSKAICIKAGFGPRRA